MTSAPRWSLGSPERLDVLEQLGVLPGVGDETFDCYSRLVTRLLGVPVGLVSFVHPDRQVFASSVGLEEPWRSRGETPISMSFCQHVVKNDDALVVTDATTDERVCDNPAVEELDVRAYLGVPLRGPGGEPLGSLCAIDDEPRTWTDRDLATMEDLADGAATAIALRISEHRQRSYASAASHQLRTPLAAMRLEVEDMLRWPEVDEAVRDRLGAVVRQVEDLSGIVDDLLVLARSAGRLQDTDLDLVELATAVAERWRPLARAQGRDLVLDADAPVLARSVGRVLRHALDVLVENALAHGTGTVTVRVRAELDLPRVLVIDEGAAGRRGHGQGPDDGSVTAAGHGIGLPLAEEIVHRAGGRLSRVSGTATTFELLLPPPTV
jgi:signal transduction histidine kinase